MTARAYERNHGIDLLRIISMSMVVLLHVQGMGGVLRSVEKFSFNYYVAYFLESFAFCAVNIFALITGYLAYKSKLKYRSIIKLWVQVFFYSVLISIILYIALPGRVSPKDIIRSFYPTLSGRYWYFTYYFAVFFLSPYINKLIDALDRLQFKRLLITMVLLFSVMPALVSRDVFNTSLGYSPMWLIIMYFSGAYIKKYTLNDYITKKRSAFLYLVSVVLVFISIIIIGVITMAVFKETRNPYRLLNYTSPFIYASSIGAFLCCLNMKFNNRIIIRLIAFFSPISFGVYLIHMHPVFKREILINWFVGYADLSPPLLFIVVLLTSVSMYIICALIDYVRLQLFKIAQINKFAVFIEEKTLKLFDKLEKGKTSSVDDLDSHYN